MSLSSMTGFGRAHGALTDRLIATVVIRSVNHKFLDAVVRTNGREDAPELEAAVRRVVLDALARGRVTIQVSFERSGAHEVRVVVNSNAVTSLVEQLAELDLPGRRDGGVELGHLLAVPGLVEVGSVSSSPTEEELAALEKVTADAVAELVAMRRAEGETLGRRIGEDLDEVEVFLDWIEPRVAELGRVILERLRSRLDELVGTGTAVEPERLVQEAAVLADRSDITEELVRLRSHLDGFRDRLASGGVVGRSLDFMCQEILRELNTLGSKCREVGVAERLVDAKASLERVREQVQNLE